MFWIEDTKRIEVSVGTAPYLDRISISTPRRRPRRGGEVSDVRVTPRGIDRSRHTGDEQSAYQRVHSLDELGIDEQQMGGDLISEDVEGTQDQ